MRGLQRGGAAVKQQQSGCEGTRFVSRGRVLLELEAFLGTDGVFLHEEIDALGRGDTRVCGIMVARCRRALAASGSLLFKHPGGLFNLGLCATGT